CNTLKLDYDYLSALNKDFEKSFNIEQKNNWHNLDIKIDSIPGMSVERAYSELLNGKIGKKVVVAVIDAGIDITHEDIKDLIWINDDEIAGNNIDDDKNGYVDDINGWNFLGNSYNETLEMTRIIRDELKDNRRYEKAKETINLKIEESKKNLEFYNSLVEGFSKAKKDIQGFLGMNSFTEEDLNNIETTDSIIMASKQRIQYFNSIDVDLDYLKEGVDYFSDQSNYHYNVNFNGRLKVGDDIYNIDDVDYGNPNVSHSKKTEDHGTHVAGIIAGIRSNNIGNKGVNNNLEIMPLRAVPNGDEYDKDIALAIKYAVDNGARIINMSFGKSFSSNPEWVIDAIKYAADNDVLIVHAAGNDAEDLDNIENENYPNDQYLGKDEFSDNFITVGASTMNYNENLIASFSNYGNENVDVFAPGYNVFSLTPENEYEALSGTSMAAPAVSGVASLVLSYFPKISAKKLKEIILESGIKVEIKVNHAGKENISLDSISKTGKIVNAYNALIAASKSKRK
ncbi:MAG: S8 family peptidase, partial [Candidatus Neomarinimicrobiota bacterium]